MKFFQKCALISFTILFSFLCFDIPVHAQEVNEIILKARVLDVLSQETKDMGGTQIIEQTLNAEILEGGEKGKHVTVQNDYVPLEKGDYFYVSEATGDAFVQNQYSVFDLYRLPTLYFFMALFFLCVLVFGGIQGFRGLIALAGGIFVILYVLFPGILHGYSPVLVSILVSSIIVIFGSYVTHGFNRTTTSAVFGMIVTVFLTGILAWAAVHFGHLTGFNSEESIFLNSDTNGKIDFAGLLLGGIMIGLLGILYDIAIGQAIAVEELRRAGPHLSKQVVYKRAIRMGREHIGALVNTLAIAYVGAALPLLLLFYSYKTGLSVNLNREIFATEIFRTLIGSIGLILAVPITTFLSLWFLKEE